MTALVCPRCSRSLPVEIVNTGRSATCRGCRRPVVVDVYPAAHRRPTPTVDPVRSIADDAATCFFHEQRAAQNACEGCGRFVCTLCDVTVGATHLCPECLEARQRTDSAAPLASARPVWDRAALFIALLALLLSPFTMGLPALVAVPAIVFIMIRHRKTPGSLVDGRVLRYVFAVLLSLIPMVLLAGLVLVFFLAEAQ